MEMPTVHQRSTKTRHFAVLLLSFAAVFAAVPTHGESTPEAQIWLAKLLKIYERGPFVADYQAKFDTSAIGQPIKGEMRGEITYGDQRNFRMDMTMEMVGMPSPDGSSSMEMELLSVSDGEVTWTQIDMPTLGQMQVMKLTIDEAEEMAVKQFGGMFGMNPSSMDPVSQLEAMTKTMDFRVIGTADDEVTLEAKLTADVQEMMGEMATVMGDAFILVLDKETGFPLEMRSSGTQPMIQMWFEDLRFMGRDELPAGVFEYTPPEGVQVMDLNAVLAAQGG